MAGCFVIFFLLGSCRQGMRRFLPALYIYLSVLGSVVVDVVVFNNTTTNVVMCSL